MLTETQAQTVAQALFSRLGDLAVAVAVLRSQLAKAAGDMHRGRDWQAIATHLDQLAVPRPA